MSGPYPIYPACGSGYYLVMQPDGSWECQSLQIPSARINSNPFFSSSSSQMSQQQQQPSSSQMSQQQQQPPSSQMFQQQQQPPSSQMFQQQQQQPPSQQFDSSSQPQQMFYSISSQPSQPSVPAQIVQQDKYVCVCLPQRQLMTMMNSSSSSF